MRLRTKLLFAASVVLMAAFSFNVSAKQYRRCVADSDRRTPAYTKMDPHSVEDDIAMGCGLYPWAYMLLPSLLCGVGACVSWSVDRGAWRGFTKSN